MNSSIIDFRSSLNKEKVQLSMLMFDLDSVTNANIYFVQLLHPSDKAIVACSDFYRAVKNLSSIVLVSSGGDCATRFIISSHVNPAAFEKLLTRKFEKYRSNPLFNIIF